MSSRAADGEVGRTRSRHMAGIPTESRNADLGRVAQAGHAGPLELAKTLLDKGLCGLKIAVLGLARV